MLTIYNIIYQQAICNASLTIPPLSSKRDKERCNSKIKLDKLCGVKNTRIAHDNDVKERKRKKEKI